ncbi:hypothetical protein L1987_23680 [Smallanthus sonchifolius]|uniref:Uncharacterized protein n=1 Tax=Smallanthus sonchifolius TaxID=185202 RepID=A0ACB9IJT8_9ASTR|nr:hypothetical protein L1987_23680 [Smallanthus sonchifolius]
MLHSNRNNWDFLRAKKTLGGVWWNIAKVLNRPMVEGQSLRHFMKGEVGDGTGISFWLDPWIVNEPLRDRFPNLFRLEGQKRCTMSDRCPGLGADFLGSWHWSPQPASSVERPEWIGLRLLLSPVALSDSKDGWGWLGDSSGEFSVGSVKRLIDSGINFSNMYVMKWCKWIPAKCNIFAWRAEMDIIPTIAALRRRNVEVSELACSLCGAEDESTDHLFSSCIVASVIWQKVSRWCRVPNIFSFSFRDLLELHNFCGLKEVEKEVFHGIVLITCWSIWKARNELRFKNKEAKIEDIFSEVKSIGFLWLKSRSKIKSISWGDWCKFVIM